MSITRNEFWFGSQAGETVVIAAQSLIDTFPDKGDTIRVRAFNMHIVNYGDGDLTFTPQLSTDGVSYSDFPGGAITVKAKTTKLAQDSLPKATHWRVKGTGDTLAVLTLLDKLDV